MSSKQCPACYAENVRTFHEQNSVPVHSVLNINTKKNAIDFTKGDIKLGFCDNCGFIFNQSFNPDLISYSPDCEDSQGYSPTFIKFLEQMIFDLTEKYDLRNKKIIEIGCGKGEFLQSICEFGNNSGVGFDPAYVEGRLDFESPDDMVFIKDYYSQKYIKYKADFIVCRMTLEHIPEVKKFIEMIRESIGSDFDTIVFIQVPNVTRILENCAFEDIFYEHCSYFSKDSLTSLLVNNGFEILDCTTVYDEQYLMIEAKPVSNNKEQNYRVGVSVEKDIEYFRKTLKSQLNTWGARIDSHYNDGKRVVLWGSSSKGVAFLNLLDIYEEISYVVDINPHRQNTYMAGTGQLIVAPDFLQEYRPDLIIIMNGIYKTEIQKSLSDLNVNCQVLAL